MKMILMSGGCKTSDTNPFRYCGEYYDSETGLIYLRNRYYDSTLGRFISEDPARDGTNWYVYCENNPVGFVDPLGLELTLSGTDAEKAWLLDNVKKLTGDILQYKILPDQRWQVEYVKGANSDKYPVGTNVIRRIVNNQYNCNIVVDNGKRISEVVPYDVYNSYQKDRGTGNTVFINAKNKYKVSTTNGMQIMETYIVIGHELIHVLRNMHGNRKSGELRGFIDGWGYAQEELEVSGIDYFQLSGKYIDVSSWQTSENSLRTEHKLPWRLKYEIKVIEY